MRQLVKWIVGGLFGALVGVGIWSAVAYLTVGGYVTYSRADWYILLVVAIIGFSVRAMNEPDESDVEPEDRPDQPNVKRLLPGVIAASLSVISIVLGKYLVITLFLWNYENCQVALLKHVEYSPERVIDIYAWHIYGELLTSEQKVALLKTRRTSESWTFPPEVMAKAKTMRDSMPSSSMAMSTAHRFQEQEIRWHVWRIRGPLFFAAFTSWSLIWYGFSVLVGFLIASGKRGDRGRGFALRW